MLKKNVFDTKNIRNLEKKQINKYIILYDWKKIYLEFPFNKKNFVQKNLGNNGKNAENFFFDKIFLTQRKNKEFLEKIEKKFF